MESLSLSIYIYGIYKWKYKYNTCITYIQITRVSNVSKCRVQWTLYVQDEWLDLRASRPGLFTTFLLFCCAYHRAALGLSMTMLSGSIRASPFRACPGLSTTRSSGVFVLHRAALGLSTTMLTGSILIAHVMQKYTSASRSACVFRKRGCTRCHRVFYRGSSPPECCTPNTRLPNK